MKVGIMQPYFMPYIGYFQLIAAVDFFIVYDNIKYTKKGWINRNRLLRDGADVMVSLPLAAASDSCNVVERQLAADFKPPKLLAQIAGAYRSAPFYRETMPLVECIVLFDDWNLFRFNLHSIQRVCAHFGVTTPIRASSDFAIDHALTAQDKVLALCAWPARIFTSIQSAASGSMRKTRFGRAVSICGSNVQTRSNIRNSARISFPRCRSSTS